MKRIIEQYNDLIAPKYDETTQGEFEWQAPFFLAKHITPFIKRGYEVLDIGVGTGQTTKVFTEHGANITGIDVSQKMLNISQSKFRFKKLIKYDIERGLLNLFPSEKFDIITVVGLLEFVKDIKKALKEIRQLLKRDGVIAFTYEVFEPNNKHGIKKESALGEGLKKEIPRILSFKVYRRVPNKINRILGNLSLTVLSREKFVSYLKSQQKIPVSYEILIVTRKYK